MKTWLTRWRYRYLVWMVDKPNALARRVRVENALMRHFQAGTSPSPDECRSMAVELGVQQR